MNETLLFLLKNNEFLSITKVQEQLNCGFNKAGKIIRYFIDDEMVANIWTVNKGYKVKKLLIRDL